MLTSKQRAYLRGLANPLETIFQIGKGGMNDQIIKQADEALTVREIIKLRVLETSPIKAKEAAVLIAEGTNAVVVQVIGQRITLYRQNPKLKEKIILPK